MAGRQSFAGLIKDQAGQEAWLFRIHSGGAIDPIFGEDRLNLVPQDLVDNWLMLCRVCIPLMCNLAAIEWSLSRDGGWTVSFKRPCPLMAIRTLSMSALSGKKDMAIPS